MDFSLLQVIKKEKEDYKEDFEHTADETPPPIYIEVDIQKQQKYDQSEWGFDALKTSFEEMCLICGRLFKNRYLLLQHNVMHLYITIEPLKIVTGNKHRHEQLKKTKTTKCLHQCDMCNKVLTYKTWNSHIKEVHSKGCYVCGECGKSFQCKRYLRTHIRNLHRQVKVRRPVQQNSQICQICSKVFRTNVLLHCHMRNTHSAKQYKCEYCNSTLKCYSYYLAHLRRVHYNDGKEHRCDVCGKKFKSPRYVNVHKRNSHRPRVVKKVTKVKIKKETEGVAKEVI